MLEYVCYFNRLYHAFREIDESGDGSIDVDEFAKGCKSVGICLSLSLSLSLSLYDTMLIAGRDGRHLGESIRRGTAG